MKRNFKRTLAKVMAVALTVALAGTAAPEADAAKKAKLSAKSVTVVKGKSKKVTIKNVKAKQVKKLAVTTSNKKIATVKKKGKTAFNVTGKKAGNAKVTVKLTVKGKKKATKLTLKVKVKNATAPKVTTAPTAVPTTAPTTAPVVTPPATTDVPQTTQTPVKTKKPTPTPTPAWEVNPIKNIQLGGNAASKLTYFNVDENGTADLILNENAKYGNVYTYFDVVLPEGSTVKDLYSVKFDFEAVSGDLENKKVYLLAGSPDNDSLDAFPGELLYEWDPVNKFTNIKNIAVDEYAISFSNAGLLEDQELEIDTAILEDMELKDNKIRFSIFAILDGVKGANTEYKVGNIRVLSKNGVTDGNDKPSDKIDATEGIAPAGLVALGRGTIAVGDETTAEAVVKNASIVGDIKEAKWSTGGTDVVELKVNADDSKLATITAKAAGVETVSVEITTTKDKTVTFTKQITVTTEKPVIEDITLELTENNVVKIEKDMAQGKGKGTIDITKLIEGVDLANYENITMFGSATYKGESLEDDGILTLQFVNTDASDTGLVTVHNIKGSSLAEGKGIVAEGSLETLISGSSMLKLLFQNSVALTDGDLVITIDKVVLNAKKDATEEPTE